MPTILTRPGASWDQETPFVYFPWRLWSRSRSSSFSLALLHYRDQNMLSLSPRTSCRTPCGFRPDDPRGRRSSYRYLARGALYLPYAKYRCNTVYWLMQPCSAEFQSKWELARISAACKILVLACTLQLYVLSTRDCRLNTLI